MKIAQVIMEHELLQLEENSSNSLTTPASTGTYTTISSAGSTPVACLDSPNDTTYIYTKPCTPMADPAYIICQSPPKESSAFNYLNTFSPR